MNSISFSILLEQRAARLSTQLLTFSKGGAPLKRIALVAELVQHAAEFSLHGCNLRAAIEIDDHLGKSEIDVSQVEQVLNVLILNVREAMPEGGGINLSGENVQIGEETSLPLSPGRYIKISVADHGPVFRPDLVARIFDPYFTTKANSQVSVVH